VLHYLIQIQGQCPLVTLMPRLAPAGAGCLALLLAVARRRLGRDLLRLVKTQHQPEKISLLRRSRSLRLMLAGNYPNHPPARGGTITPLPR